MSAIQLPIPACKYLSFCIKKTHTKLDSITLDFEQHSTEILCLLFEQHSAHLQAKVLFEFDPFRHQEAALLFKHSSKHSSMFLCCFNISVSRLTILRICMRLKAIKHAMFCLLIDPFVPFDIRSFIMFCSMFWIWKKCTVMIWFDEVSEFWNMMVLMWWVIITVTWPHSLKK